MANILLALEARDIGTVEFQPSGKVLAAIEQKDTASFFTGSILSVTEKLDRVSILIGYRPIILAAFESPDVGTIDILQGTTIELSGKEHKDSASIDIYNGILVELSATERYLDQGSFDILTGTIGSLAGIESGDIALVAFSADSLAGLVGIENTDYGSFLFTEAPITYIRKAVVMHLFNYAVTEYKNYNFNSLLHVFGVFLGVNENGVYLLDGDDDLGELIQARIKSGLEDLAAKGAITIPREAWLAYRSDDGMELNVRTDEKKDLPSMVFGKVAFAIRECRKKLDRGIKDRFFTWDLKNVEGSDFSMESLRIMGDLIKRKTR